VDVSPTVDAIPTVDILPTVDAIPTVDVSQSQYPKKFGLLVSLSSNKLEN